MHRLACLFLCLPFLACAKEGVGTSPQDADPPGTGGMGAATKGPGEFGGSTGTGGQTTATTLPGAGGSAGDALEGGVEAGDGGEAGESCMDVQSLMSGWCNSPPFPPARTPFTVGTGSAPAFTGGALVDGLYAAVKVEGWGVGSGQGRQMGIVIANGGTTMLWFGQTLNRDGSGDVDAGTTGLGWLRGNFSLSVDSSNTLALAQDCFIGFGLPAPTTLLYTATATDPPQLILADTGPTPTDAVVTYERRGCP